jgi:hypothetical protein
METLYENPNIRVSMNTSGEVFVRNLRNNSEIRIADQGHRLLVMAWHNCKLLPTSFNGLSAFAVEGGI